MAGLKLLALGLGDLTGSCFEDVSASFLYFNHQSLQKGSELCLGICRMQTSESKEMMVLQKGTVFSSRKLHAIFGSHCGTTPGNWAERGILMSQDAESPDRPLVVVFYGWLVPKLTENR